MRKCRKCHNYYNNDMYLHCPFCSGERYYLDDDPVGEDDEEIVDPATETEEEKRWSRTMLSPGIFDDEGEWVKCPNCGMGIHDVDGTRTCPFCGPV